jgi:hypothetical protein
MLCLLSYRTVILLRPALLQANNVWPRTRRGDLDSYLREALIAQFGDKLEAPAIE